MAERRRFAITDVSGGMNPDRHPLYIEENEAADILNFRVDRVGSLVGRRGRQKWGVDTPSGTVALALGRWVGVDRFNDYQVLVALSDGTLRVVDPDPDATDFGDVIFSGLSSSAQGMFLEVEDLVLYANGVDDIVAYDGSVAVPLSLDAPASLSVSVGGSGSLTGTYRYAVSYVSESRGMESPPVTSSAYTASGEEATISVPVSSHPWVDAVNIYRTTDGGATYMFLGTKPNDGDPFVDDGTQSLSPLLTPELDNIVPGEDMGVRAENIAYHKGRLWASIGDELYWSRPYQLNLFPYFTNTKVPFEGNDRIKALKPFQDYLLVFGEMNTILVTGDGGPSGLDINLTRQDTDIGATSRHAMVEVDNQLLFLSARGLYVFPEFGEFGGKLTRTICEATVGCRSSASMVYVPEERSVWLSITDRTWVIHLPNQGVTRYDFYMGKALSGGANSVSPPLWLHAEHARLGPQDSTFVTTYAGSDDFGAEIPYYFQSRIWELEAPDFMKYWRRVGLFVQTGGEIQLTVACPDTARRHTVQLQAQGSSIGSVWSSEPPGPDPDLWDSALWSFEGMNYFVNPLPAQRLYGRSVQLSLRGSSDAGVEVHSPVTLTYRASDRFLGR